jgi:hypothetical protein
MAISSKLRRHKIMQRAILALMGNNLPPRFKFQDTYSSIQMPTEYQQHLPTQEEVEAKFTEIEVEEEIIISRASNAFVISKVDSLITSNLEVGTANLFVDTLTGNVGIGTTTADYSLHVVGSIYSTQNITAFSDERMKENILPIDNALEKICSIGGYTYNKVDETQRNAGVLAQEVMKVLPEVVHGSEDTNYSVAYGNLVSLLIEAIKELNCKVEQLENKIHN